jgi:hypothetical protein
MRLGVEKTAMIRACRRFLRPDALVAASLPEVSWNLAAATVEKRSLDEAQI